MNFLCATRWSRKDFCKLKRRSRDQFYVPKDLNFSAVFQCCPFARQFAGHRLVIVSNFVFSSQCLTPSGLYYMYRWSKIIITIINNSTFSSECRPQTPRTSAATARSTSHKQSSVRQSMVIYSVSQKNPPLRFSYIFPKRMGIFSQVFTHLS